MPVYSEIWNVTVYSTLEIELPGKLFGFRNAADMII